MSNLDNLINRILEDGRQQAEQITSKAKSQADEIIESTIQEMDVERQRIIAYATSEAKNISEGIIENQKFEMRNLVLQAKQAVIDKVFSAALEKLNAIGRDEFVEFLKNVVPGIVGEGEQLLVPRKYDFKDKDLKVLNDYLKKNQVGATLSLYNGDRDITGGFILIKEGIEKNYTFETLLSYNRYELEIAVIDILFGKGDSI
jgi:V/A-type H+-transporting ATPase subunit E